MVGHRDDLVITSKVAMPTGDGVNDRGLSRRHIMLQVEGSLRRLNTDRIDLYFVHHFDASTDMEETLRALDDLVRQGKVLYLGVSNWAAWQIAKALGISPRTGLTRFECIQPMYNLAKRQAEVEILPLAASEQFLGVISYSPLGGGLLTGKYSTAQKPDSGRLVSNAMYAKRYGDQMYFEIAERFAAYAQESGTHPVTLAVAWVMTHSGDHRADHRGTQHGAARPSLDAGEGRHGTRAPRQDFRALVRAAARHGSRRGKRLIPLGFDALNADQRAITHPAQDRRVAVYLPEYIDRAIGARRGAGAHRGRPIEDAKGVTRRPIA